MEMTRQGKRPNQEPRRRQRGITMIELMIVIVIVAILGSLAIPSYRDYVLRTNRADAINMMLEIASCQERTYIKLNRYDVARCNLEDGCRTTPNDQYQVCITLGRDGAPNGLPANQSFDLAAAPQGTQTNDDCGTMTLNDIGTRGAQGGDASEADTDACWKGRKVNSS